MKCDGCGANGAGSTVTVGTKEYTACSSRAASYDKPVRGCIAKIVKRLKPCPGCGEEDAFGHLYVPGQKVCGECRKKLCAKVHAEHSWYQVDAARLHLDVTSEQRERLGALLRDAVNGTGQKPQAWNVPAAVSGPAGYRGRERDDFDVLLTVEQVKALDALAHAIEVCVQEAHAQGVERGRSLLVQLAEGDVSLHDYDRKTRSLAVQAQAAEEKKKQL